MQTSTTKHKYLKKAAKYFSKMYGELDLKKYKLEKYQNLFELSSLQDMHDSDLAYHHIYGKCAEDAVSKKTLLNCLDSEERFLSIHPNAFNADNYRMHTLNAINEIRQNLTNGSLDQLF